VAPHRRFAGAQLHDAIVGCAMITTSQLTALMRDTGHHDVAVIDQPRSSRIVTSAGDHPNPTIGQPDRPVVGPQMRPSGLPK
jgi:hypothetical protein